MDSQICIDGEYVNIDGLYKKFIKRLDNCPVITEKGYVPYLAEKLLNDTVEFLEARK